MTTGVDDVVDSLVHRARDTTGLEDLGSESWREGLRLLVETVETYPGAVESGRDGVYREYVGALSTRLRVIDYLNKHPEVADEKIERPLFVLGLPRTGTTVATSLLAQDPSRRALLNWEASDPVPPATSATLRTDPRCIAKQAAIEAGYAARKRAGVQIPHWENADDPTECCFVQCHDFKSFLFESSMPTSAYSDWYLAADVTSTYEYERSLLQLLQSKAPGAWSLKLPSHAVHIDTLLEVFPDARLVWSHRDPFKATASFIELNRLSRPRIAGPGIDLATYIPIVLRQLEAHVDRLLRARDRIGDDRFFHLHYADAMEDPIDCMRRLYDWAGDPLSADIETAMLGWLERNPQGRVARTYSLKDQGVTKAELEPIFADYLSTFDIALEDT